jgi:hypothetical protein
VEWRYYAQRLITGAWLDRDLQLSDATISWTLSGPGEMTATVDSNLATTIAHDGFMLLDEWSTAIYAELNGIIRWGGIMHSSSSADNGRRTITVTSFTGYAKGRIYEGVTINPPGHKKYFAVDAFDIVRMLWEEVQHDPNGDIGMIVSDAKAGVVLGDTSPGEMPLREDYDTNADFLAAKTAWQTAPNEPYELAWWNSHDMGDEIDNIMQEVEADYREVHEWASADKNAVIHRLELNHPAIGVRRHELRFVEGENIYTTPAIERTGENYSNHVYAIGAGEDRHTLRREASAVDLPRVRRDKVVGTKDVLNLRRLKAIAQEELVFSRDMVKLDSVEIIDHPNAPMGSWGLGDEIFVRVYAGFEQIERWVRIVSYSVTPNTSERINLTIVSAENAPAAPTVVVVEEPTPAVEPVVPPGVTPVPDAEVVPIEPPEDPPAPAPNPAGRENEIRVASFNLSGPPSTAELVSDLEEMIQFADVIGIQEGGDRGRVYDDFLKRNPGWGAWIGTNLSQQSVGILHRKSLGNVTARSARLAVGSRYLGPRGAGGATSKPKYVMRLDIMLSDSNRKVCMLNTHMIPSATRSRESLGADEWRRRQEHYRDHVAGLVAEINARNALLFVTGDFNATPTYPPLDPFWAKVNIDHDFDTHGNRRIDFITHRPHAAINVVSSRKMLTHSDHDTPIVTYRIKDA